MTGIERTDESYCTTGRFARLGRGYDRHCGPTAITNLVLTLERDALLGTAGPAPVGPQEMADLEDHTFLHIARLGIRRRIYWNTSFFGLFGGTSDWLVRYLIRRSIMEHGLGKHEIKGPYWTNEKNLDRELEKGNILYLMTHGNSKYKSHHMLCYGKETRDGKELYRVADGWRNQPQYLTAQELRYGLFYSISRQSAD